MVPNFDVFVICELFVNPNVHFIGLIVPGVEQVLMNFEAERKDYQISVNQVHYGHWLHFPDNANHNRCSKDE
jgi:hypothetical protein